MEFAWLPFTCCRTGYRRIAPLSDDALRFLDALVANFSIDDAAAVKAIEATTNHDVKAVEYWIKDQFKALPELAPHAEFVHFACASEGFINNVRTH